MLKPAKKPKKKVANASSLVQYAVQGIEEKKGSEIVCINLKKIPNNACDYFLICEGTSRPHVQAIAGSVEEFVKKSTGERPWHVEGLENGEWVLMDYIDVAVHIFQPEARNHYNLENLWADAEIKRINEEVKPIIIKNMKKKKSSTVKKAVKKIVKKVVKKKAASKKSKTKRRK
jgi:ribosome-associated protein